MLLASTPTKDYAFINLFIRNTSKIQSSIRKISKKIQKMEAQFIKQNNIKDLQFEFSFDDHC